MKHIKRQKAGGVLCDGKDIYVVYRENRNHPDYSLPKGHCEEGESLGETAVREVLEETGVKGKILGEITTVKYSYEESGVIVDAEVHYYAMNVIEIGDKTFEDDVSKVFKFPVDKVEEYLTFENDKGVIKKWKELYYKK